MESTHQRRLIGIRVCLAVTSGLGLLLMANGITAEALVPAVELDVVLTPEQLQDPKLREDTTVMLHKLWQSDNQANAWIAFGAAVAVPSLIGLWLSRGN